MMIINAIFFASYRAMQRAIAESVELRTYASDSFAFDNDDVNSRRRFATRANKVLRNGGMVLTLTSESFTETVK